jgi:type I restriction enzyme, R subunit
MIEFKQIIGRGTRLYDGKDYFTIYDYVKAYKHFNDPQWDGEPEEEPTPITARSPREVTGLVNEPNEERQVRSSSKIIIKLRDGREREIEYSQQTSF